MPFFSPGSWFGARLPLEGGGDDLCGEVEVVPEVLDALVGQVPVVRPPRELLLNVTARLQRLQRTVSIHDQVREFPALPLRIFDQAM